MDADEVRRQLTAALAAKLAAQNQAETQMSMAEERATLLAEARRRLSDQQEVASEAQKQQALLNQQVAALRQQLSGLQALLDDAKVREAASEVQLQSLGNELNTALARVAAEERRRRMLEEEKLRLAEAENEDLEKYRSEFFGRLRDLLGQQEGVRIVGDRFVFSSEVLFAPGEARLSPAGSGEIAKVAGILRNVTNDIPEGIDWVLQVDGHTDNVPLIGGAAFADNWELSQARALSVVRYLVGALDFPADRLSANGFGEYQPINPANTPEARAQNRRIELKLTGK
jgi:chemotaxis protein MotB